MHARLARALARRAGIRLFRFFARPLAGDPPSAPWTLSVPAEPDLRALCADPALDLREPAVREACARGDVCIVAWDGSTAAGYCWLGFTPLHHLDGVWVDFDREAVWTYKSLVRPSHRGRGIAPALYRFADRLCRERGRARSILCIENDNTPSARAALNAGYAHAGYAAWRRTPRAVRTWRSRGAKRLGIRFYLPA